MEKLQTLSATKLKDLIMLHQKKYRYLNGYCLIEGVKLVNELINSTWEIDSFFIHPQIAANYDITPILNKYDVFGVNDAQLKRLSELENPEGILALVKMPQKIKNQIPAGGALALYHLNDPGNVGTLCRSAEWFGIQNIIVSPQTADVFNSKTLRASMGACFRLLFYECDDFNTLISQNPNRFVIATMEGIPTQQFNNWSPSSILVLGNETHGIAGLEIEKENCITLMKTGNSESLNVAVAGSILLFDWKTKLQH